MRTYGTFDHTSYYAMHFAKILSLLMHKLFFLQKNDEIIFLYSLFCDIVQFHVIDSPNPKDFFLKHEKVINLFYSLHKNIKMIHHAQ